MAHAQESSGIQVKVVDQEGRPLEGEPIAIQNSDYYTPNEEGLFMLPDKKLRIPVRAELRNELLSVLEIAYFEEESRLQVKVNRTYHPNDIFQIVIQPSTGGVNQKFRIKLGESSYVVPFGGVLTFDDPVRYKPSSLLVNAFEIEEERIDSKQHRLLVKIRPLTVKELLEDTLMLSYEADFHRITREIEKERSLYEAKNHEIHQQIVNLHQKLSGEEHFSEKQRVELKRYLRSMEKVLQENSEAIRKSEERTKEAIARLRMIILEKDSLNMVAQARIVEMEVQQEETEKSYKEKIKIYASIIVALLVIALVVYSFAVRFNKQKQWLSEVNKSLKKMQEELTRSLQELNLRKAQIEDHNNQLELFVYKASHDIKGPLRSIIGLTHLGLHDVKDTTAQEYFGHIQKSTQRLDNLLVDLLKLTKAKQAEIEKQELNLPLMVNEIINSFKNTRHFDRMQFNIDIPEEVLFRSDEKLLYSVIQNFIENGIKYCDSTKEQPYLNITVRQEQGKTTLTFEDNGPGISPEHLPKIFDMFYKTDPASDGTGLGLHIVKVTIEKLGGTIKVRSRVGSGSSFTITFYE